MRKVLASLAVGLFVFSMNINADEGSPSLQQLQKACELKQVAYSCTVPGVEAKTGTCIDAQWYGYICDLKQTPEN